MEPKTAVDIDNRDIEDRNEIETGHWHWTITINTIF
jgi:hypothetical protein